MRHRWIYGCVISLWLCGMASAQAPQIGNYSGDFRSRPALTGDWGGLRNTLAEKGVNFDVDMSLSLQGVNSGGRAREYKFGGWAEYALNLDFGKMGLWPGGFLNIRAESQFGEFLSDQTGSIAAANIDGLFPVPFESKSALSNVVFTQFLAPSFGVFLGKLDILGGDANAFAHDRKTQFMNVAMNFNLVALRTVPYSPLGAGVIVIPTKDVLFSVMALDTEGDPERAGFDTVFESGTTLAAETRVTIQPFGLTGHQLIGGSWSDKSFASNEQDPRLLLNFFLPGVVPVKRESGSWSVYYNFDQFLYTKPEHPEQGIGIFGRVGFADTKTSPLEQFYSFGVGGKGMIPGRARDQFGVGYYYMRVSHELPGLLLRSHEQGFELYYTLAATNWLFVTPDIQIIEPGRQGSSTAFLTGLRVHTRF
jgi:porin